MATRISSRTTAQRAPADEVVALPLVCPHLGSIEDPDSHEEQASRKHRCYFTDPPQRVDVDHQRRFCLSSACAECPWLTVDDRPTAIRAEEKGDLEQVEQAAGAVARGLKALAQISAPILKDAAGRAAGTIQGGAEAIQERVAASRVDEAPPAARTASTTRHVPAASPPPHPAAAPPPYRILTPEPKPGGLDLAPPATPLWRRAIAEVAPDVAALGAFLAALFWLSSLYQGWLPADVAGQSFWPTFSLPALPFPFKVGLLELTLDLGAAIPPAIGAFWAGLTFGLAKREESGVLLPLLLTVGGIVALNQYVSGQLASQLGLLFQVLPSVFVLVARATREPARGLIGRRG